MATESLRVVLPAACCGRHPLSLLPNLFDPPRRALVPVAHRVGGPGRTLVGVARSAWIWNLVPVRHRGSDEPEGVRVNKGARRAFGFDHRHVAGDALAARTAIFVMRVLFERGGAWAVG